MAPHKRKTDKSNEEFSDAFIAGRFFQVNDLWYYSARAYKSEGEPFIHGTFKTKDEAIRDCQNRFSIDRHDFTYG